MKMPVPNSPGTILMIGVGDEFRTDGNVGRIIAQTLEDLDVPGLVIAESSGDGRELMQLWSAAETVIIIGAIEEGCEPGTVLKIAAHEKSLPLEMFRSSSHHFGLPHAIELSRNLRELPPNVVVFGICGKDFSAGEGLSAEVERSMTRVLAMILQEVRTLQAIQRSEKEI